MNRLFKAFLIISAFMISTSALAHPGHGTFSGHEVWHYLTSPMHISIAAGVVVVLLIVLARKKFFKRA